MRAPFVAAVLGLVCAAPAAGQFLAGDVLVSHYEAGGGSVVHMRADGAVVGVISAPVGAEWTGLATTSDGLLVMRRANPQPGLDFVDANGVVVDSFETGLGNDFPGDVEVLGDGSLVLADQNGLVQRFSRQGQLLGATPTPGFQPVGLGVALDQRVWCGSPNAFLLFVLAPYGGPSFILAAPAPTIEIVAAPDDTLWTVGPTDGIVRQSTDLGVPLSAFSHAAVGTVSAFALARNGDLLVAGNGEALVRRYRQDGAPAGTFALPEAEGWPMFMHVVDPFSIGVEWCAAQPANSTGVPADLTVIGSAAAGAPLTLVAKSLPPQQSGYVVTSQARGIIPFAGGSQGHLCVVGVVGRFLDQLQSSGNAGVIVTEVDTGALPLPQTTTPALAGETWYFQLWYRDLAPQPTSNFTSMVQVDFD